MVFGAALTAAGFLLPIFVPQQRWVETTGRIVCSSEGKLMPLDGVMINLKEYDWIDSDDFIANTTTDGTGTFTLNGTHFEPGEIDFYLQLRAACGGPLATCDGQFGAEQNLKDAKHRGPKSMKKNKTSGFCPSDCVIMAKVTIPRNYNFVEGSNYPPIFNLGDFNIGVEGSLVCDASRRIVFSSHHGVDSSLISKPGRLIVLLCSLMSVKDAKKDQDTIADLRREIASLRVELISKDAEKRAELDNTTISFRAVLSGKNKKIKDLEEQIVLMKAEKQDAARNKISDEIQELRAILQRVDTNTKETARKNVEIARIPPMIEQLQMTVSREISNVSNVLKDNYETSAILRARFTNISAMKAGNPIFTETMIVAGSAWAIQLDVFVDGATKYLSAFLAIRDNPKKRAYKATYKIELMSHETQPSHVFDLGNNIFDSVNPGWGRRQFIKFEDLLDASTAYVKDDSILMKIEFTAYPTA